MILELVVVEENVLLAENPSGFGIQSLQDKSPGELLHRNGRCHRQ